ncbi:MAG TPA: hypothetical protein VMW66_00240, partial [Elusimicrobiales bacterium]|nr:hypothetical protein [Elusimicrobiales bacterium]
DFFRSNPYAISPDNNADVSLIYQTRKMTARTSYIKRHTRLDGNDNFTLVSESRPNFDLSAVPFRIFNSPFLNNFYAHFDSTQTPTTGYFEKTARAKYLINKSIPFTKHISFMPSVFYDQEAVFHPRNATTGVSMANQWTGRWGSGLNMRVNHKLGNTDLSHSYMRRLKANKIYPDSQSQDYGIEQHLINMSHFFRPHKQMFARFNTGFDLRDQRNAYQDFSARLQPLSIDIFYAPNNGFSLFMLDSYKTGDGNQSFVMQATLGSETKTHWNIGLSNYKTNPADYLANTSFMWKPLGRTWWLEFGLGVKSHITAKSTFQDVAVFSKRLTLYKEIHDFFTSWTLHLRPGVKSVSFNLGLKFEEPIRRIKSEREKQRFQSEWKEEPISPTSP